MRLCVIQMDMRLGESSYNFAHAEALRSGEKGASLEQLFLELTESEEKQA